MCVYETGEEALWNSSAELHVLLKSVSLDLKFDLILLARQVNLHLAGVLSVAVHRKQKFIIIKVGTHCILAQHMLAPTDQLYSPPYDSTMKRGLAPTGFGTSSLSLDTAVKL